MTGVSLPDSPGSISPGPMAQLSAAQPFSDMAQVSARHSRTAGFSQRAGTALIY
jgi:hypothetical protein